MDGCGFVAAGRYVITAAHCLPRIPDGHFDEVDTTIRSWDGNDETKLVVIYCDPISDIAVLKNETLSGGELPQECTEAFDRLVARTGSAHRPFISRRNAFAVLHSHTIRSLD